MRVIHLSHPGRSDLFYYEAPHISSSINFSREEHAVRYTHHHCCVSVLHLKFRFFILIFLLHMRRIEELHPMGAYSEEHLLLWRDMHVWLWHLWQDFALFFFCLLVQPDSLLFCLKWDKPWCFPPFTLTAAGFPGLRDLSLHSCTCFLLFLAPPPSPLFACPYIFSLFLCPSLFSFFCYSPSVFDSLAHCAFHYSITSLAGDIKPLCLSCQPLCGKFTRNYSLSVSVSIHHSVAGVLYLAMRTFTNA